MCHSGYVKNLSLRVCLLYTKTPNFAFSETFCQPMTPPQWSFQLKHRWERFCSSNCYKKFVVLMLLINLLHLRNFWSLRCDSFHLKINDKRKIKLSPLFDQKSLISKIIVWKTFLFLFVWKICVQWFITWCEYLFLVYKIWMKN